eukprot:Phypoly_transcript_07969.p1 GENE.Phypoly_transcript_07969~~Phypoly_transcript_07969.p1  ORF type:complete len:483 (+),score=42.11 Phypoly_transcript_07969:115-1563(+)
MFFSLLPALGTQFLLFQQGSDITQVSLEDLKTCVNTFCSLFQHSISTRKCFIGIIMSNELESLSVFLGLEHLGVSTFLLPPNIPEVDLHPLIARSGISHLFIPPLFYKSNSQLFAPYPAPTSLGTHIQYITMRHTGFDVSLFGGETCICQLTSGTTSDFSKLAVRTWKSLMVEIRENRKYVDFTSSDCLLVCSAISHSYALLGILGALVSSCSVIICPPTIEATFSWNVSSYPTIFYGIKSFYETIPQDALHRFPWLARAKLFNIAGAPCPTKLCDTVFSCTRVGIRTEYGCTEVGTISRETSYSTGKNEASCGKIHDHLNIKLLPSPYTSHFTGSDTGELCLKSPCIAIGYIVDHKLIPCTDENGWYKTGDIVKITEDQEVSVLARAHAPILVGAERWPPALVEKKIMEGLVGIKEICVILGADGVPLIVVSSEQDGNPVDEGRIRNWIAAKFPPNFPPVSVKFQEIPKSPAGKVLYNKLK